MSLENLNTEQKKLVTLGNFLKTNGIDEYSRVHIYASDDDGMAQLSERQDLYATFVPKTGCYGHLDSLGIRGCNLALWTDKTESGFVERAKLTLDIVTVRFVLEGQVSPLGSLTSLNCAQGHGLLLPHAEIADLTAEKNTRSFGLALDRSKLIALAQLFERPELFDINKYKVMAELDNPGVKSCMELSLNILQFMSSGSSKSDWLYNMMEEALFIKMLTCWPRTAQEKTSQDTVYGKHLKRALEFINENIATPISVADIAKSTGIGIRTLQKMFKEQLGVTPYSYIINCRLDRVRAELRSSHSSAYVSQVAFRWGFQHMGEFSSRYKKRFGVSPKKDQAR